MYHLNPNTGDPVSCNRETCPIPEHYADAAEARGAYEEMMQGFLMPVTKKVCDDSGAYYYSLVFRQT